MTSLAQSRDRMLPEPAEVKSLTFVTLRDFLPKYFEADQISRMRRHISTSTLHVLDGAESGGWAPERCMQEVMQAILEDLVSRNDEAFLVFARALASAGINRFMRVILSLTSARFVLKKVPVVWGRLRRGPSSVTVRVVDHFIMLDYADFPFFRQRAY